MLLLQFPAVNHPQSLERRYLGILNSVLLDLMKVGQVDVVSVQNVFWFVISLVSICDHSLLLWIKCFVNRCVVCSVVVNSGGLCPLKRHAIHLKSQQYLVL